MVFTIGSPNKKKKKRPTKEQGLVKSFEPDKTTGETIRRNIFDAHFVIG